MSLFTRRSVWIPALLLVLVPVAGLPAAAVIDNSSPQALIDSSSRALLADLDANRASYRKDINGLYKEIDRVFLPHVDVDYTAQQVLGKHYRTATAEQRQRFSKAFYQALLHTYGDALLEFTGNQLKVKPFKGDPAAANPVVQTSIRRSNGSEVAVDYVLHKDKAGAWKVWDLQIEGIRYVKSFREQYELEIGQKGLDALLKRLESGQLAASAGK